MTDPLENVATRPCEAFACVRSLPLLFTYVMFYRGATNFSTEAVSGKRKQKR
jgi:hypothetical protein